METIVTMEKVNEMEKNLYFYRGMYVAFSITIALFFII
jgi:hypothetical protein